MHVLGNNIGRCVAMLLRPLARFCLRHGQSYQEFSEIAKLAFIRAADETLSQEGAKVNVSRISVLTGIYRPDVTRLIDAAEPSMPSSASLTSRVLSLWEQDPTYRTKGGQPRTISYQGESNEFHQICSRVSKAINPGTILFELERNSAVEKTSRGLRLTKRENRIVSDPMQGFSILARDLDTLIRAAEQNLVDPQRITNLHIRTEYDNILKEHIPKIRRWMVDEGKRFHKRAREFLARYDQDINPGKSTGDAGAKVCISAFSFTEPGDIPGAPIPPPRKM